MATLNTRIKLRIDTLESWQSSSVKLLPGEVAFATVAASAGTGLEEPVVMMKVGTEEEKTFSELPWAFHAKASDVLAACKTEAGLRTFVNGVIADAGIASSEAMEALAGRVTTAEGKITTLEGEMDAVEAKAAANETAIGVLNGLVGDTKVSVQISNAIAELDLANTYEVKGAAAEVQGKLDEYKTANDAAVQKNASDIAGEIARAKAAEEANANAITAIKDGTTIDSFADVESALEGKQAVGDYATKADAQGYANAKDAAIAEAKQAGENAQAAAEAAQADADALEALVGDTKVSVQISNAITELDLANTYAEKEHTHTKAEITDFAHNHEMSEVNGLTAALAGKQAVGDYATKAEAQAMADAKDTAIQAAQAAADKAQGEVDALETAVGTLPEGKTVMEYIDAKTSGIATDAALAELQDAVDAIEADYLKAADKTELQNSIKSVSDLVGDTKVSVQISTAVEEEANRAKGIESGLDARIKAVEDDYLKAADKTELTNAIATAKQEAVAAVLGEGVDEDFDTLKEVADWILSDTTGAAALQKDVAAIKADYLTSEDKTELEGKITSAQNAADKAQGEVDALEEVVATKAAAADLTALEGRVSTVEGKVSTLESEMDEAQADITALEGLVGDTKVSTQISEAVAAEAEIARAAEKKNADDIDALEAKVSTWDAAVQSITPGEGLVATKSGTDVAIGFDEECVFVFDCGNATV